MLGDDELRGVSSIDVGSVRLTETFLHGDPPLAEELSNAIGSVHDLLDHVERELPGIAAHPLLVGIAGTITTITAVEIGLAVYDATRIHGASLSRSAIEDVFRTLATESAEQRAHNPGLEPGRVDVIVGGAIVLVNVMRVLGFDEVLVSEADILDGLARSLS